jgi:hypothetical protein
VHDDVPEIQEHPPAFALALSPDRPVALRPQSVVHLVDDGAYLALVRAGADDEVVRDHDEVADLENADVYRLFLGGGVCGGDRRIARGRERLGGGGVDAIAHADFRSRPITTVTSTPV